MYFLRTKPDAGTKIPAVNARILEKNAAAGRVGKILCWDRPRCGAVMAREGICEPKITGDHLGRFPPLPRKFSGTLRRGLLRPCVTPVASVRWCVRRPRIGPRYGSRIPAPAS